MNLPDLEIDPEPEAQEEAKLAGQYHDKFGVMPTAPMYMPTASRVEAIRTALASGQPSKLLARPTNGIKLD